MATITENPRTGGFLLSEASGTRSRDTVTLAADNGSLAAGTVLGVITVGGNYAPYDATADDGTETAAAVLWDNVDTTGADAPAAVIARDAEVAEDELVGIDAAGVTNLAAVNIRCR
jgi:hypothetical protein